MVGTLNGMVIGLGKQSYDDHIPALLARHDVAVCALVEPNADAVQRVREAFPDLGKTPSFKTIEDALAACLVDFAIVAVPHHHYYSIVKVLCSAQIPFMKEKPLARTIEEADRLLDISGFSDYAFVTAQRRFSGLYSMVWQGIGKIGQPYLYTGIYKLTVPEPFAGWRGDRELAGGGCLLDMGYHTIDQLLWWFGTPDSVYANVSTLAVPEMYYSAEDSATVAFSYEGGLHGTLLISRSAGPKEEQYQIYGTEGYIIGTKRSAVIHDREGTIIEQLEPDRESMISAQLKFFLSRAHQGKSFEDTLEDHVANMRFIAQCYRSAIPSSDLKG